jgi:hypothetical protein
MTAEERTRIQEAARRYVRQHGPTPPTGVLERVARIVLQARPREAPSGCEQGSSGSPGRPEAA